MINYIRRFTKFFRYSCVGNTYAAMRIILCCKQRLAILQKKCDFEMSPNIILIQIGEVLTQQPQFQVEAIGLIKKLKTRLYLF